MTIVEKSFGHTYDFFKARAIFASRPFAHKIEYVHMFVYFNSGVLVLQTKLNRRIMLIDREHYLQLLNRAQFLEHQNQVLVRENQILSHELQNQKCANYELMEKLTSLQEHTSSLNSQVMQQNQAIHSDIKGQMIQLSMKQKKYLEEQFQNLEHSSFQKYKLLEIKNTAKRIENHELSEFCEKIKKIYKKYNEQKEPSLNDVVKWIKTTTTKKNKSENRCQDTEKKHLEATKTSQLYKPK